ncbi:hypothetical protein HMPREF9466_01694 [Fusobacterium necrophorum subsp. funduliforme 1_1_36S]|nr:hypothetical protein HMPREF9466_01694 [Fusobacterium necrophorum subsp. funduliforme 1_1_36S]
MLSKGHLHLKKLLETFCKLHELELMTEVKEGDLRYDFYIPTSPPLVLEFNGIQHKMDSPDGFFFKTTQDLLHYKKTILSENNYIKLEESFLLKSKMKT